MQYALLYVYFVLYFRAKDDCLNYVQLLLIYIFFKSNPYLVQENVYDTEVLMRKVNLRYFLGELNE